MDNFLLESRMFLHDTATPLTIVRGALRRIQTELSKNGEPGFDPAICLDRLGKAFSALDQLEGFHASHKARIAMLEPK
jgi:hypothetical protein